MDRFHHICLMSFLALFLYFYSCVLLALLINLYLLQTNDFWREARILSNLHHPNVVAFYGVVPDAAGGTLATVTEFMANGSLRNVLIKKDR